MANENLKKWLAGDYVSPPDFKKELIKVVEENEKVEQLIVVTGKVYEREIDYGNSNEFISEVRDENDYPLSNTLDDLIGKKVKVIIEVID